MKKARLSAGIVLGVAAIITPLATLAGPASASAPNPNAPESVAAGTSVASLPGATVFGSTPDKGPGILGPGGGRIGAVLVSRFIKPGTVSKTAYNHYSLLKSIEDFFGLDHLGYAGQKDLKTFGKDVFTQPGG